MEYSRFIEKKRIVNFSSGFEIDRGLLNSKLFDFQKDIVSWSLKKGKSAIFADCGLGKTPMQLEWARQVSNYTGKRVLILAPLAVSKQTQREGNKFDIDVNVCREQKDLKDGINITNYEILEHFDISNFAGIVLDESSILKSYSGKMRNYIIDSFCKTPYRLACTATPAPNDYMELGNHAEFLGVMKRTEMLSTFFTHDMEETSKWRLKGHAQAKYWEWLATWAVVLRKPSDLGYKDEGFALPELKIIEHIVESKTTGEYLIPMVANTLDERRSARRSSINERVSKCCDLLNDGQNLIWCDFNNESELLRKSINGSVEVKGSDTSEHKENAAIDFSSGKIKALISKPSMFGYGLNFQQCNNMIFVGLSDSYEQFYQAVRRCWRFGQKKPVNVHIIISEAESSVLRNIKNKERMAREMIENMTKHTNKLTQNEIHNTSRNEFNYQERHEKSSSFDLYLGDCVESIKKLKDDSIHFSIFSPPFASLYTYTNSDRDMGNCRNDIEFYTHFKFLVKELHRVIMPGRLVAFHCMNLPTSKERDGIIGIRDFRGELIRIFTDMGFVFHSEVCIWKDPVTAMQRTKALGLLHKQIKKDSCMSRQGIPDYLCVMRKKGDNPERVTHTGESFPVDLWQQYASPVWMDINPSNTLQKESARENNDERHICPLQLQVIERALNLWTNPGDTVLSPFAGIGSEGYQSIKMKRKFIGFELKESYFKCALNNLKRAEESATEQDLFSEK